MSVTKNPVAVQDFTQRSLVNERATLAGGAGSSQVLARSVPLNRMCIVRGVVRAVAGVMFAPFAAVADTGANTLTKVGHGLANGQPVFVGFDVGGSQPGGVTAGTMYFVNAPSVDTLTLHATYAAAVAGTGIVDISSIGASVRVWPSVIEAVYNIFGVCTNREGTVSAVGSASVVANEEVAAWDCTISADNTNKTLRVMATPDAVLQTRVESMLELFESSLDA